MNDKNVVNWHRRVIEFVVEYKVNNDGVSPSIRQIIEGVGLNSTSEVSSIIVDLVDVGLFEIEPKSSRSIRVMGGRWQPPFWYDSMNDEKFEKFLKGE